MSKKDKWDWLLLAIGIPAVLALCIAPWWVHSYFEAKAFNRITGKSVTTWEAMWISLRVDSD